MQIPGPDTRVVELRVHGILGTSGDTLTDSVASVDVAGDGVGRIVRPADRLRRPVPGPMLSAGDRTVPRIVEGYVWGAMTSGGLAKATWALLFPFALSNMAHWMLPPAPPNSLTGRAVSAALRSLLRLAALLLTMLFVAQLSVVTLDMLAAQCLSPASGCLTFLPSALREMTVLRAFAGLLPVGLVVLLMHRLSAVSWHVSPDQPEKTQHSAEAPMLPGSNVVSDPDSASLRALHVTAALSTLVLVALGGPLSASTDPRWLLAIVLIGVSLIGTAAMDDPIGRRARTGTTLRAALARRPRRVLMTLAALAVGSVAVLPGQLTGPLPGSGSTIDVITALLVLSCTAVAVLLVPAALLARPSWSAKPRTLRPWAGGWMAAPVLLIAGMLGDGFGAGLALALRQALGGGLRLPAAYDDVTVFWGTTTILLAAAALVLTPVLLISRWWTARSEDAVPAEVALLHAGRRQDQRRAARAWHWADLQRRFSHRLMLVVAGVLAVSATVSGGLRLLGLPGLAWADWLVGVGVVGLAALAIGLLRMVQMAATERKTARYLGILCDLTLFWPRESHPVVPPCYALKVIPELVARATEHLAEPNTRVVLVGHSQGSLLATVAAARLLDSLPEADRERVGLVTAGSQLQWAYPRAFPGVIPHDSLLEVSGTLAGRWRALCRGTDPIGGGVTTWNRQVYDGMLIGVGFRGDGSEGPLPVATRGPTGALVLGSDHWLPDPQRGPFSYRRWGPGVRGHFDYAGDPEWDRAVSMAAGLEVPVRGATLPLRTPTTTPVPPPPKAPEPARVAAHSSDNGSLGESAADRTDEPVDEQTERSAPRSPAEPEVQPEPDRSALAEPPELPASDPRVAPWERGVTLSKN